MIECSVRFSNGRGLHGPQVADNPCGADYLRVVDDGTQEAMITVNRLRHDPPDEMGRLMDALTDGRPAADGVLRDPQYPSEAVLVTAAGQRQLRVDAAGGEISYVRVCGREGDELVYWSVDEWAENPELVCGALLGALNDADDPDSRS